METSVAMMCNDASLGTEVTDPAIAQEGAGE